MIIKQMLYIQAVKWCHDNEFKIEVSSHRRETDGYNTVVDIEEKEIVFHVPEISENELTAKHIEQLQAMKLKVLADNHLRLQKVDDEISSLLAIENKAA